MKKQPKIVVLKDSGKRRQFKTGAVRDRAIGKGRYDLIPPCFIQALAMVLEAGAMKYTERNFELGMPLSWFLDSALRHSFNHLEGKRDEKHAFQAAWNWMAYIYTATMIERGLLPQELNDLPNHLGKGKVSPL